MAQGGDPQGTDTLGTGKGPPNSGSPLAQGGDPPIPLLAQGPPGSRYPFGTGREQALDPLLAQGGDPQSADPLLAQG